VPITGARRRVEVPDDVDLEGTLSDWQAYRSKKRLADVHWVDALYRAYLAALVSGAAVLGAASLAGDGPAHLTGDALADADALVGCVVAAALFVALRSGSRGGPLALEAADVRHVLLSPVDRVTALRRPALRQLRFLVFAAGLAGAIAGNLANRRLDGNEAAWIACGALAAVATVTLAHGVACATAGLRVPSPVATLVGIALVALAIAEVADVVPFAPTTALGKVALWPLLDGTVDVAAGVAALVAALAAVVVGLRLVGGTSLERLERRSRLVGQIRFAATLQDLRTVVVLRRQLTQERARTTPWVRPPLPARRFPVLTRDLRSLLRWPIPRFARLLVVVVVAGLAARAAYDGTSPMVVVAGLALFLGGLDAAEPLGQEVDHPTRRDDVPRPAGWVYLGHLPVVLLVSVGLAAAAAAVAVLVDPVPGAWPVALACVLPAALGAAAGATVNVLMGAPDPAGGGGNAGAWALAPPEAAGMRMMYRLAFPPALAVFGATPLLLARAALDDGRPPAESALDGLVPALAIFTLVGGWVRFRDDIKGWWAAQMDQALPTSKAGE
jgi:hypothetical protein